MAKVSQNFIMRLGKALQSSPVPVSVEELDGITVRFWSTDDLVFMLDTSTRKFYGLKFSMLNLEYFIADDLSLVLLAGNQLMDEENESYLVEDEGFVAGVEFYLTWRTDFLEKLHV